MADRETEHECDNCGKTFTIINHEDNEAPEMCPWCGADLENDKNNDDDNDFGDDY